MTRGIILLMIAISASCMDARAADQIKLGLTTALSGPGAISGTELKRGFDLAIEELGSKLGGTPVTVYVVDDQSSPSEAVQSASKLIDQYKVDIVTGFSISNTLAAEEKSFLDAGITTVSALAGPAQYAGKECNANAFFVAFQNEDWPAGVGKYLTDKGIKSVYFIGVDYLAGWEQIGGAIRTYKGKTFGPVFTPLSQLDFSAELAQVRAAKPDAVFVFNFGAGGIAFVKQYAQSGLKSQIPLYSVDTIANELSFPAEGEAALGMMLGTSWNADLDNPANKKFVSAFVAKYGRRPAVYAALAYDAVKLLDSAVAAVQGKIENKDAFRAAIKKADFQSVRGSFRFNNNNFPFQDVYMEEVVKDSEGIMKLAIKELAAKDLEDNYHQDCPLK
jgi:branched-chain amino acid transport system substrate-binding protein